MLFASKARLNRGLWGYAAALRLVLNCLPILIAMALAAPSAVRAEPVVVFAAASLKNALDEVAKEFMETGGEPIVLSYAASSALARQIQQGAPAHVFISANPQWMDLLEREALLVPGGRFDLLGNRLTLIAHGRPPELSLTIAPGMDIAGLLGEDRLAMALVDAAPAGIYGKAALQSLGVWEDVAPKVAQTDNVRAALALVVRGETPLGIVYATDAIAAEGVTVLGQFPAETHPAIIYPAAAIAGHDHPGAAEFLTYLRGPGARLVFEQHGFTMLAE